jgi:hypothetical protein
MNAPQYYGAQPYPPLGHHGNAGPWGYGHYPPSAFPNPFPYRGDMQPTNAPVQATVMPVRTEVGVSQATNQATVMPVRAEVGVSQAANQATVTPVRAEVGVSQATNQAVPSEFRPKRNYPNKQVSEGGMSD